MPDSLLRIDALSVEHGSPAQWLPAVDGVDLHLEAGEMLALTGESGCGKSTLLQAIAGLLPATSSRVRGGQICLSGRQLLTLSEQQWRQIRGREIAWLPQNPMNAFNPVYTVGRQLVQLLAARRKLQRHEAAMALDSALAALKLSRDEDLLDRYPHQLSGGTRQRLLIALALACRPKLLLADEPTSALDGGSRAAALSRLRSACLERGIGVLTVTHDLALVAGHCDRVAVMYCGQIVESGPVDDVFSRAAHPYTAALLAAHPAAGWQHPDRPLPAIPGQQPTAQGWSSACRFAGRCSFQQPRCTSDQPAFRLDKPEGHGWRCHFPLQPGAAQDDKPDP